jgi:hypothetical protein
MVIIPITLPPVHERVSTGCDHPFDPDLRLATLPCFLADVCTTIPRLGPDLL